MDSNPDPDRPSDAGSAPHVPDPPGYDMPPAGRTQTSFLGSYRTDHSGRWQQTVPGVDGDVDLTRRRRQTWTPSGRRTAAPDGSDRTFRLVAAAVVVLSVVLLGAPAAQRLTAELRRPAPAFDVAQSDAIVVGDASSLYDQVANSVVSITTETGSSGSGWFYRPGLVATNWHVVAGPGAQQDETFTAVPDPDGGYPQVQVRMADGRVRQGRVSAADARLDVALVEVDISDVTPLQIVDPDSAQVGQQVYVVGSPFGIPGLLTAGVLTGTSVNTAFATDTVQTSLLSTDAAANPGNSGGPLLNEAGQVLGLVTLRPDSVGGRAVQGLTLALPGDTVAWALAQLEVAGQLRFGAIGVTGSDVTPDDDVAAGVVVDTVAPDSPATAAGIRPGDVIVAMDGTDVDDFDDLVDTVRDTPVGRQVPLTVVRDGRDVRLHVTPQDRPEGT